MYDGKKRNKKEIYMKKVYYITLFLFVMFLCSCTDNKSNTKEEKISTSITGESVSATNRPTCGTSVFSEDTDEWRPYVDKLYYEQLKKGKDYTLYISNYPVIDSEKDVEGTFDIGDEELYYSVEEISESSVKYYAHKKHKKVKTIKYKNGFYIIYKRVGNRFYSLWIDLKLEKSEVIKKAKKIFNIYCTL